MDKRKKEPEKKDIKNKKAGTTDRQTEIKKNKLENVFMKHYAPNYMLAYEQNMHVSQRKKKPKSLNNYFCQLSGTSYLSMNE